MPNVDANCLQVKRSPESPMERLPTPEQLASIVDAARHLIRTAFETFCVDGQVDPPGFSSGNRWCEMPRAILHLERLFNPSRIIFGSPRRHAIGVAGWPDVTRLGRALSWLRELLDLILTSWKLEPLCGADGYILLSEGSDFTGELRPGITLIRTPTIWPPKIDRAIIDGMHTATTWITEVVGIAITPGAVGVGQGGGDRILERAMPGSIGTYVAGDVNSATQGSNIAALSPNSGPLTQTTAGAAKPNPLTLVWQSVRKAWSAIAAVKGWWPAIRARLGSGR